MQIFPKRRKEGKRRLRADLRAIYNFLIKFLLFSLVTNDSRAGLGKFSSSRGLELVPRAMLEASNLPGLKEGLDNTGWDY